MAWVKAATLKTDASGVLLADIYLGSAAAQNIDFELHYAAETKPETPALAGNTSFSDSGSEIILINAGELNASAECDLWLDYTDEAYTGYDIYANTGTVANAYLNLDMFDTVTSINIANSGLEALTGITTLSSMNILNLSNNSMTSAQVNAIVDDVFDMAITNVINNGTLNITGNDAPTGDSLLAYNALVGKGWNSGTPTTDVSNRFELQAIGLLLNGNFNQTDNINLGGAGAVWLDTDGTTVIPSPVVGGSLDVTACDNHYTDAVIGGTFTGSYNGNGYEIIDMAIKQQTAVAKYCGLFEQGSDCQITKLTISGNMQAYGASGSGYSGGLIGNITGSISVIDKSISNVNCLSGSRVGGFVGYINSATITNCYSTGDVASSGAYTAGFVGLNQSSATITDCYATGSVSSSGQQAGGFVGNNQSSATITDCYATGAVSSSGLYAGGFVGRNEFYSKITDCYSTGAVSSSGLYAGGFVGNNYISATITDCYSTGAVSSSGSNVGGFVGHNYNSSTITTSFCYGEVSGTSTSKGAFAGRNETSDILDCYYRGDYYAVDFPAISLDETGETNTIDITPLTSADFRNKTSFVGFDFAGVWTTGQPVGIRAKYSESNTYNTVGYPLLRVFETITRPRLRKRFYK